MVKKILLCWLGMTDLNAASGREDTGLGPVAQAVEAYAYLEVLLLNNWDRATAENYVSWLQKKTSSKIALLHVHFSGPTNFGEIYQAASKAISEIFKHHGSDTDLVFHLSPGTPAMAAVWILLAKTRFSAEMIESSKEYGVRKASVPFDISADFIPELLRKSDKTLERLAAGLPAAAPEFDDIIHRSEVMQQTVLMARRIAPRSIPVLIEGESGTGKELFARAIHDASPRKDKPFVAINCGAIPFELVESELFGHEKGAFTGATAARIGHFEAAHEGTIFLDEIGELPKSIQVKLLRTLQEGEVRRIGSTRTIQVNIRIIAATNRNLIHEATAGNFREDLFYRLAVAVIKLPPLRERTGNIRELQNTLTRAAVWSVDKDLDEGDIQEALLPIPAIERGKEGILNQPVAQGVDLPKIMKTVAVHYLEKGLSETRGNKTETAKILGLPSYQTLTNWLKKYGLE
jgi:DNA-binding NtrC family response regulator